MRHVDDEFTRPAELSEKKKMGGGGTTTGETDADTETAAKAKAERGAASTNANIPSPANQADLLTSPGPHGTHGTHRQRRESTTTVGSDDTALEVFGNDTPPKNAADHKR